MTRTLSSPFRAALQILLVLAALPVAAGASRAEIPATPVMTVYRFDGPLEVPTFDAEGFARRGTEAREGSLAQGTSVVPCLFLRDGVPLTDESGTPYVGFEIVVDSRTATPDSTALFRDAVARRRTLTVENHHCPPGVERVVDVRNLHALDKAPYFDPPAGPDTPGEAGRSRGELDAVVRAFHASRQCDAVQRRLVGRRAALDAAWDSFVRENRGHWPESVLQRARSLDYVMRTAIYEGHLDRGCSAYGACERNTIALSIRNRVRSCASGQGCRFPDDFQGVASAVSQYNIWDEFLTQVTGLASCFLRDDLAGDARSGKLRAMYEQSREDLERILFGDDEAMAAVFPGTAPGELASLRHYYHPPAMGKCFPENPRVEYMSGAVARKGSDFALLASTRIEVGEKRADGYEFRDVTVEETPERDRLRIIDGHPGFVVDARKVSLRPPSSCRPWGTPPGCRSGEAGRYRKLPTWLSAGRPLELDCRVRARGAACDAAPEVEQVKLGGVCDTAMQPIAGVP